MNIFKVSSLADNLQMEIGLLSYIHAYILYTFTIKGSSVVRLYNREK